MKNAVKYYGEQHSKLETLSLTVNIPKNGLNCILSKQSITFQNSNNGNVEREDDQQIQVIHLQQDIIPTKISMDPIITRTPPSTFSANSSKQEQQIIESPNITLKIGLSPTRS